MPRNTKRIKKDLQVPPKKKAKKNSDTNDDRNIVYIVCEEVTCNDHENETNFDINGVYTSLKIANEKAHSLFLNLCDKDDDLEYQGSTTQYYDASNDDDFIESSKYGDCLHHVYVVKKTIDDDV